MSIVYITTMKKYIPTDFNSFFARQQSEDRMKYIDWDILEKYAPTDIIEKTKIALQAIIAKTGQMADDWYKGHPNIKLCNGKSIPAVTANTFALSNGHYVALKGLEIFEETFSKTTNLEKIFNDFSYEPEPAEGEYNFGLVVKMFPFEATHIYFEKRFLQQAGNYASYQRIKQYLDQQLVNNGLERGPLMPPLNALEILGVIAEGWQNMGLDIQTYIIPQLKRSGSQPPMN